MIKRKPRKRVTRELGEGEKETVYPGRAILINLPKRPERLDNALEQLAKIGVEDPLVLPAFDVTNVLHQDYSNSTHTQASLGCTMSHMAAWKMALALGWKDVLVFEDDLSIPDGFELETEITRGRNWDMAFFGWLVWKDRPPSWEAHNGVWGQLRNPSGTQCYYAKNLEKILSVAESCYHHLQIDGMITQWSRSGILDIYWKVENHIDQGGFPSDINQEGWNPGLER